MSNKKLLEEFYLLAEKIGIKIIKGKGDFNGGICKVNDKNVIVINYFYKIYIELWKTSQQTFQ